MTATATIASIDGVILGLDPGSYNTGYAVLECTSGAPVRYVECGVLQAPRRAPLMERLAMLGRDVEALVSDFSPTRAVVEDVFSHGVHPRSALVLGQARGAVLYALLRNGIEPVSISPAEVKMVIAGHGRATKEEVRRMAMLLAGLTQEPPTDASDALAMAFTLALLGEKDQ